jgi:hypothetical protein
VFITAKIISLLAPKSKFVKVVLAAEKSWGLLFINGGLG